MFCTKCKNDVADCTCPDIDERLAAANQHPNIGLKTCPVCKKFIDRCKCKSDPVQELLNDTRDDLGGET